MPLSTETPAAAPEQQQSQGPLRAGNLLLTQEPERPPRENAIQSRVAELRSMMARGENPLEQGAPAAPAPPAEVPPAVAPPADAAASTEPEAADLALPEGYRRLENGQIQGPDGRFVSEEQLAELLPPEEVAEPVAEAEAAQEPVRVTLPGRRPEDADEEWEIDDPELAARINQLRNGFMRREELHRQMASVQQQQEELAEVRDALQHDPVNFILDSVQPTVRADLVRHLLADDEVYNAVIEEIAGWDNDPAERRARAAELRAQRYEQRDALASQVAARRDARNNALEIRDTIRGLIPEDWNEERAGTFYRYAIGDLKQYVTSNNINQLPPADVPVLLQRLGILQLFGIPVPAAPGTAPAATPPTGGANTAAVTTPAPTAQPAARPNPVPAAQPTTAAPAQTVGERFRAAHARRSAAAAVTPAGVGAAPARPNKPEGMTVAQSIEWARQNMTRR